tara:strand:+ start:1780 stop:2247 length:468 start_codon:yes stop_codon:yes gene_type:complete
MRTDCIGSLHSDLRDYFEAGRGKSKVMGRPLAKQVPLSGTPRVVETTRGFGIRYRGVTVIDVEPDGGTLMLDSGNFFDNETLFIINNYSPVTVVSKNGVWRCKYSGSSVIFYNKMMICDWGHYMVKDEPYNLFKNCSFTENSERSKRLRAIRGCS